MIGAKVKLAIVGTLLVALAFVFWQWRGEIADAARWAAIGAQLEQTIAEQEEEITRMRAEQARLEGIAEAREDAMQRLVDRERRALAELRELEESDEEVRRWADTRLPDALLERLRVAPSGTEGDRADEDGL